MQISIIVLTYNSINYLEKCFESIFNQTYKDYEVIFIDNFSTDGTYERIKELKKNKDNVQIHQYKNCGNMASSRNIGIKISKNDYLAFHDSDDFWYKNKLETSVPFLKNYDLVYHNFKILNEATRENLKKSYRYQIKKNKFEQLLIRGNPIATSSVVCKKKINNFTLNFTEEQKLMAIEDYDLWLKLAYLGCKFKYIEKDLGYLLERVGSESKVKLNKVHGYKIIFNKYQKNLNKTLKTKALSLHRYRVANILFILCKKKSINFFLSVLFKKSFFRLKILSLIKIIKIKLNLKNY